jgi:hypothetical protein
MTTPFEATPLAPTSPLPSAVATVTVPAARRRTKVRKFALHYLEMVVAMLLGMVVLGPLEGLAFDALGWAAVTDRTDVTAVTMAANMTVAMAGWMRFRGHTWRPIVEMSTAMVVPFLVMLVPLWLGAITESTLWVWGHVLMLVGMLAAMLLRPDEYTGHCH